MTSAGIPAVVHDWTGLCPKSPVLRTAPALIAISPDTIQGDRAGGSGPAGRPGRIRQGIHIAVASLKAIVRNRYLLIFPFLFAVAVFLLAMAEFRYALYLHDNLPFTVTITAGNQILAFDPWFFLVETACLSCFALLTASLALHRNAMKTPATIREGLNAIVAYAKSLIILSIGLALAATMVFSVVTQNRVLVESTGAMVSAIFWIPRIYLLPEISTALYLSFLIMIINIVLFLFVLCLVPVMVLEKKGIIPALVRSVSRIQETWRELLGCVLVYATMVLAVAAAALVIGQLPQLLIDNGYARSMYLGHLLMPFVYYGFVLACLFVMALGLTAAGTAIRDLSRIGKPLRGPGGDQATVR